jgi:hypothetical protein
MMARDPNYTPFVGRAAPRPRLDLLQRCWRLRALPTGRELVCGIFQTAAGLEVRAGYRDDLLHSQMCPDLLSARAVAERLRGTLLTDLGSVEELPLNETDGRFEPEPENEKGGA